MSDRPIVPTADAVITPVLEKLYELRPNSFPYLNLRSGVYWHPVAGFRGQAALSISNLATEVGKRRMKTAEGADLLRYVASECDLVPDTSTTKARGILVVSRDGTKAMPPGDYPKGTRITRTKYTASGVTLEAAEYELEADLHLAFNSTAQVSVPVQAANAGKSANAPVMVGVDSSQNINLPGLVPNVTVVSFEAAGGADKAEDDYVRAYGRAYNIGQFGPTSGASKLAALASTGVRKFIVYDDVVQNAETILVADEAWGSGDRWAGVVQQAVYDSGRVGFGCKVAVGKVRNRIVSINAAVSLRDTNYMRETTDIDNAIRDAARSYFDDRDDWNIWNSDALRSAISRSHDKIYTCTSVTVGDVFSGSPLTEILTPDYTVEQFHYYLAANAVNLAYSGPV